MSYLRNYCKNFIRDTAQHYCLLAEYCRMSEEEKDALTDDVYAKMMGQYPYEKINEDILSYIRKKSTEKGF